MECKSRSMIQEVSNLSSHVGIRYFFYFLKPISFFSSPKTLAFYSYPNPNFRISRNSIGSFPLLFLHLFRSFSIYCGIFGRNSCSKVLHSIVSPLSSPQRSKTLICMTFSKNPKSSIRILTGCPNFPSNFMHLICFSVRSFSTNSSSSSSMPPSRSSQFSTRKRRPNFDSDFPVVNSDRIEEILELIERGETDMELKLNKMHPTLSVVLVGKIIGILNDRHVSALRFFDWIRNTQLQFIPNSEIYNLIIDNCGRIGDYESMFLLLSKLSAKRHCLTEKAFGFLTVCSSARDRILDSVESAVETLNRVRGSCRSSGIYALIKTLCAMNYFDGVVFVMEETARKTSYYNVLVAAKCRNGDFQEALDLFDEMRRFGCDPNTKSYNYLLGSLSKKGRIAEVCELIEVMEKLGYLPDSVTFEIVIVHACRIGSIDFAIEFLYHMMSEGLEPRITTHAVFIKGYFWSGRVDDAYKYVVDMIGKDKYSANMNYSLLASLFHRSGRVIEARDVLIEMTEKGLKPNFPVYMRVMKDLFKLGKGDLVAGLKANFSRFHSSTGNG